MMSEKDLRENRKKRAVVKAFLPSIPETWSSECPCVVVCPYEKINLWNAIPEKWRPVDDRPINRRLVEYQLNNWFRRIHLGRLIEAGFPPPPPVESDSDDDNIYD